MVPALSADILHRYRRFSLFNSPYVAHLAGHAIDLYPGRRWVPSPVEGEVTGVRRVSAPPKPYAAPDDVLLLVDTGTHIARLLHVDPIVGRGDRVQIGENLGRPIRSGYFAPWVDVHLHLDIRTRQQNPWRARGSLPIALEIPLTGVSWDGTGRVIERAPSYVVLDAPTHPAPGEQFVGLATDDGGVLDGGVVHYDGGGVFDGDDERVTLLGAVIGTARDTDQGNLATVEWDDVKVRANGQPVHGLSCALAQDGTFGAKLVEPTAPLEIGDQVRVEIDEE